MKAATDPIKKRYADFLEALKKAYGSKGDVSASGAIQKEIDSLRLLPAIPAGALHDKLVIWNQNNGGKGDRGTKKINVILSEGGREVWKQKGLKLTWNPDKQTKDEFDIPAIKWDKIRIEVAELVNQRGGLAEVEVLRGGKNILLGATAVASGYWETNPKHAPTTLTDGLQETFWLLNDRQEGWAEISLKTAQ